MESDFQVSLKTFLLAAANITGPVWVSLDHDEDSAWTLHSMLGVRKTVLEAAMIKDGLSRKKGATFIVNKKAWTEYYNYHRIPFKGTELVEVYYHTTVDATTNKKKTNAISFIQLGMPAYKPREQNFDRTDDDTFDKLLTRRSLHKLQQQFQDSTRSFFESIDHGGNETNAAADASTSSNPLNAVSTRRTRRTRSSASGTAAIPYTTATATATTTAATTAATTASTTATTASTTTASVEAAMPTNQQLNVASMSRTSRTSHWSAITTTPAVGTATATATTTTAATVERLLPLNQQSNAKPTDASVASTVSSLTASSPASIESYDDIFSKLLPRLNAGEWTGLFQQVNCM